MPVVMLKFHNRGQHLTGTLIFISSVCTVTYCDREVVQGGVVCLNGNIFSFGFKIHQGAEKIDFLLQHDRFPASLKINQ